jgi:hypothetical protein
VRLAKPAGREAEALAPAPTDAIDPAAAKKPAGYPINGPYARSAYGRDNENK